MRWLSSWNPSGDPFFEFGHQRTDPLYPVRDRGEAREFRQRFEGAARVGITCFDGTVKSLPVEQIDVRKGRLQQHIGKRTLHGCARRAVDQSCVHEYLKNVDALAGALSAVGEAAIDREVRQNEVV